MALRLQEHKLQVGGPQIAQPIFLRCLRIRALASRLLRLPLLLRGRRQAKGLLPAALNRLVL